MPPSLTERRDYGSEGLDGDIGRISDVAFQQNDWSARYAVVDTGAQVGRVLRATDYVPTVDLGTRSLYLSLPRDAIAGSPVLHAAEPAITPEFERSLREYYDRYSR